MESNTGNYSLSSLSGDSDEDMHVLNQAIKAGLKSKSTPTVPPVPPRNASQPGQAVPFPPSKFSALLKTALATAPHSSKLPIETDDSMSSIDESDELLMQNCIRRGLDKTDGFKPIPAPTKLPVNKQQSPKRSQLPTFSRSISQSERDRQSGMEKNSRGDTADGQTTARPSRSVLAPTNAREELTLRALSVGSKNEQATSAAVSGTTSVEGAPNMAPGVEPGQDLKEEAEFDHRQPRVARAAQPVVVTSNPNTNGIVTTHTTTKIGSENGPLSESFNSSFGQGLHVSGGSMNVSCDSNVLERSNEYPALRLSNNEFNDDSINESSIDMEVSNEFLMENIEDGLSQKIDRHKDPDQMRRSIERLTHKFVSQAEFLRTSHSGSYPLNNEDSVCEDVKSEAANNRTWNEDSCVNDVSYPSISITAPIIKSINDDSTTCSSNTSNVIRYEGAQIMCSGEEEEPTPTNECKTFIVGPDYVDGSALGRASMEDTLNYNQTQPESLNSDTNTLVGDGSCYSGDGSINFRVGGEVQQPQFRDNMSNYLSSGPYSVDTYSTMTNSTIIAMEANKLCTDLLNMAPMTDSMASLDLDNIRPPSAMDNISISAGYFDTPNSPQLSRLRKKSLPQGIMARRALTQSNPNGSLESVNSSCNLDNIKPPSLMDELLDSMISVDSITSEVVDNQNQVNHRQDGEDTSQYETANSEYDDTTTLRSCMDLPTDNTPIPSDFSSAESTPKKVRSSKRTITPRQKRQTDKERYKTYNIGADKECGADLTQNGFENGDDEPVDEEMIHVEIEESEPKRLTPRQRRQEDPARFVTQVLDTEMIARSSSSVESSPQSPRRSRDDPRYLTRTISNDESESRRRNLFCEATPNDDTTPPNKLKVHSHDFLLCDDSDSISLVSNDDNDDMSSIRALMQPFKHLRDLNTHTKLSVYSNGTTGKADPVIFEELKQTIHTESQLNSIEFEQNSETESCDQNMDDETYTIQKPKPRIVKPTAERDCSLDSGNSEGSANSPESKGIRGRKKATYISPYKMSNGDLKSPSKSQTAVTKVNPKGALDSPKSTSPLRTSVPKTNGILNKSSIASKLNSVKMGFSKPNFASKLTKKNAVTDKNIENKSTPVTKDSKQPSAKPSVKTSELTAPPPQMPNRQGTFVKDEPSVGDVPIVYSEPSSPVKTALTPQSKIPATKATPASSARQSFISKLKSPLQRSATTTQPLSALPANKRNSVYKSPSTPFVSQRSNSNASIKSAASSSSSTTVTKQVFSSQPPSRSNSNITSRIAGLWKRSDSDAKKTTVASKTTKRNSVNITPTTKPPTGKLSRSSTFDNTPPVSAATKASKTPVKIAPKPVLAKPVITPKAPSAPNGQVLRRNRDASKTAEDEAKRISRLGSFF